jgi:hypothetical protein
LARDISFPKTRHVALSFSELPEVAAAEAHARAGASDAVVVPAELARPAPGAPLPEPAQPGGATPGTPSPGELPPASEKPALAAGASRPLPLPRKADGPLPHVSALDLGLPAGPGEACRSIDGAPLAVRCPSSAEGRASAGEAAARAVHFGEALLLTGLDCWYRLGTDGAGFCRSCELALIESLRESYGDHVQPFDALALLRGSPSPQRERPFALQREALRYSETIEAGKRAVLRARDEARQKRGQEIAVLARAGPLSAVALGLCRHLDGLVFELTTLEPLDALVPLLAARAALGQRPAVALAPASAGEAQVRRLAAVATACDTDLALEPGASAEAQAALAGHRRFVALVRERYRPTEPLLDAEIVVSPVCEHWTAGAHLKAATAAGAALAHGQLLPGVRLDLAGPLRTPLLVLAGCGALPLRDAAAARRHVEAGGAALLIGRCAAVDEEGRPGEPIFPEVKAGLEGVGEGRVFALEEGAAEVLIQRAARELLGRGRAHLALSGRARLLARAYLDPERKLDVHLVNLDLREQGFVAAQGVQLAIAGQAAGGGRTGYWFSPERDGGRDGERIALNPSGFSVSTVLPSVGAYALLAVPR